MSAERPHMVTRRPRQEFSRKTKGEAFLRANGRCEMVLPSGERCPCKLQPGYFIYDHRKTDFMGGEPTLENCQVICRDCDKAKYATDRALIDDTRRMAEAHVGITAPSSSLRSRPLPKGRPRRRATALLERPLPPRRGLYATTE